MLNTKFFSPLLVFLAAMLWATDAPFRVGIIKDLPVVFIVFLEHLLSLIILLPYFIASIPKLKSLSKKDWLSLAIIGIGSSALALVFFTESFKFLNPSAAIILQKLQPFIAIILAHTILKEKFTIKFWYFAIFAVIGAYLISFPNLKPELFVGENWNPHFIGILLAFGAALLWGAGTIFGRISLSHLTWKEITASRFFIGFLFLLLWNIFNQDITLLTKISGVSFINIFIMSMVSGAVGLLIYYRGLRDTKASIATVAELGFVIASVLINYIFLDDKLLATQIVGMLIILFSILGLANKNKD